MIEVNLTCINKVGVYKSMKILWNIESDIYVLYIIMR